MTTRQDEKDHKTLLERRLIRAQYRAEVARCELALFKAQHLLAWHEREHGDLKP